MTALSYSNEERPAQGQQLIAGKRRRQVREALTGYLFVLPAAAAIFLFGLWPVVSGFYESLKSGSPLTNKYVGLNNYMRSLGSLTYILLFALSLILLYFSYRYWRSTYAYYRENGGIPWLYIGPGLIIGAGMIVLAFNFVTSSDEVGWLPTALVVVSIAGFVLADQLQYAREEQNWRDTGIACLLILGFGLVWIMGPRLIPDGALVKVIGWAIVLALLAGLAYLIIPSLNRLRTGFYVRTGIMMGLLMLLGILLSIYTVKQMEGDVAEAQDISALIFNEDVLNATVYVADEDTEIGGLSLEEEIIVQVVVDGETIEAPLAPEAYNQLGADKITGLQAAFGNNQKINVLVDGEVVEGQLTGLAMGENLQVRFLADEPEAVREVDIYSALEVGDNLIRRGGRTEPLSKQILASLGVFIGLATIYTISYVRSKVDDEEHPRLYRRLHLARIAIGLIVLIFFVYIISAIQFNRQAAAGMQGLSKEQFEWAYQYATGERPAPILRPEILNAQLLYWPQVFLIATGALLIGAAYLVWQSAQKRETKVGFGSTIMLALLMMIGGWLAIGELPRTLSLAGRDAEDTTNAVTRTAMYSLGTVPVQLAIGLFLAYLLFSEITRGKSLFRVIYFMPYIAPSVATSTVFLVIFSLNKNSLANKTLGLIGIEPLLWLKEPSGVIRLFYEQVLGGDPLNIPSALQGPSLALTTVILYNIWVFAGYNAVVFLAGLGAIPTELYEAAEVDGAGRWSRFRNITLPLLSPTTFFLSMLSIIGTFKAFSHIYVLRGQAAGKEVDTMSVHIFNMLYSANDPGYASALAFTLFGIILILTLVQNRVARGQVFYG
ncbi:MAG: sugar ABC transporter permease [Anaerolineae bacterium]|nr:sugar ABC transporter permease [Anaerolineae bacterium]